MYVYLHSLCIHCTWQFILWVNFFENFVVLLLFVKVYLQIFVCSSRFQPTFLIYKKMFAFILPIFEKFHVFFVFLGVRTLSTFCGVCECSSCQLVAQESHHYWHGEWVWASYFVYTRKKIHLWPQEFPTGLSLYHAFFNETLKLMPVAQLSYLLFISLHFCV